MSPLANLAAGRRAGLEAFGRWLLDHRGLTPGSIRVRLMSARDFMEWAAKGQGSIRTTIRGLTPEDIETFFVSYRADHGPAAQRSMQAALRLLLRFGVHRGWVAPELIDAVPVLYVYRLSSIPRGLSDSQVAAVLAAAGDDTASESRDLAILLLLATYGVRRGQVTALCLGDLDWERRQVRFAAHKGGKPITHALTAPVAAALARYLDRFRPRVSYEAVFLRVRAPYLPLNPTALTVAVHARLTRAGVVAHCLGPHTFRHAFATRLLRSGKSLKVVADLLGHRDLTSATLYGKVDIDALRQVAAEWPVVLQ